MEKEPPDKRPYYTCIKTSLKSIVKDDIVIVKLNQAASMCNKIVIHSLQFMKIYLIHLVDNNQSLPVIDKQFINLVMKTVCASPTAGRKPSESTKKIKDKLKSFYDEHYKDLQGEELNYRGMGTVLDYFAISILTMYENNIKQHFVEYIERYVNVVWKRKQLLKFIQKIFKTPKARKQAKYKLINNLRRIKNDILNFDKSKSSSSIYHTWIDEAREKLLPQREFQKNSVYYDLMCSPQDYLPCMIYMMKQIEEHGESILNACPLRSEVIPKYIRLDTTTLVKLLLTKEQGTQEHYLKNGNLVKNQEKLWDFFFKTDQKCFKSNKYRFNHMIETDGVGVSIVFIRNDLKSGRQFKPKVKVVLNNEKYIDELDAKEYTRLQKKKVVAIDPNMSDLIYCIDDNKHTFRYTQNQRRQETKQKKYRNILQNNKNSTRIENKTINEWEATLSQYNKKTLDFNRFKDYIKQKNIMNIALQSFYETYIYRKLKLSSYINRKKSETRMLNNFKKRYGTPEDYIIGFGDFEQRKHRKFKEPVKGKGFRSLFRKAGYEVYLVDEFRTSCKCSICETSESECRTFKECINPRPWKNNYIIRHGLVKCKTCSRLWNRDTNASRNIYKIIKNEINRLGRPVYLRRNKEPEAQSVLLDGSINQNLTF